MRVIILAAPFLIFLLHGDELRSQSASGNTYSYTTFAVSSDLDGMIRQDTTYRNGTGMTISAPFGFRFQNNYGIKFAPSLSFHNTRSVYYSGWSFVASGSSSAAQPAHRTDMYDSHRVFFFSFPVLAEKTFTLGNSSSFILAAGSELKYVLRNSGRYMGGGYPLDYYNHPYFWNLQDVLLALEIETGFDVHISGERVIQFGISSDYILSGDFHFYSSKMYLTIPFKLKSCREEKERRLERRKQRSSLTHQLENPGITDSIRQSPRLVKSAIYGEIFGAGGFGSINFEQRILYAGMGNFAMNVRAGVGYIDSPAIVLGVPLLFGRSAVKFETGGTVAFETSYDAYCMINVGVRYYGPKYLLLRLTFTPLVQLWDIYPFGGASFGLAF